MDVSNNKLNQIPASPDSVINIESDQHVHSLAKFSTKGYQTEIYSKNETSSRFGNRRKKEQVICQVS
jgi:hypothetical protein